LFKAKADLIVGLEKEQVNDARDLSDAIFIKYDKKKY
jgi:uncharacterized protein YuzE